MILIQHYLHDFLNVIFSCIIVCNEKNYLRMKMKLLAILICKHYHIFISIGQEVIKVLATSEDLASSNNVPVMRDIMMDPSTSWSSMLWGTAEVTLAVVIP